MSAPDARGGSPRKRRGPPEQCRVSADAIQVIAQGVSGLPPLSADAAAALAPDAEYRIREVVQDALKFARHSKRRRLTTGDVNAALRLRNVAPLYGFGHARARRGADAPAFARVDGVESVFFVEDAMVNLKTLVEAPLPPVPLDYAVNAHWLAVNGVQPAVAQNPREGGGADGEGAGGAARVGEAAGAGGVREAAREPVVKPRVKHILGKELQLYYEHLVRTLPGRDVAQVDACLLTLAEEPGLAQLVPYFVYFVRDTCNRSLRNLPLLFTMMRLARALFDNPHFDIEHYLHQLLPAVLTCLVGKRLCASVREDHWALRVMAAELLSDICARYAPTYDSLQPRITKTLREAVCDPRRPMTTHYGAVLGLAALGCRVVDSLLLPLFEKFEPIVLDLVRSPPGAVKATRRREGARLYGALVWAKLVSVRAMGPCALSRDAPAAADLPADDIAATIPSFTMEWNQLVSEFGKEILPASVTKSASRILAAMHEAVPVKQS